MDLQKIFAEIELDIQDLKFLLDAFEKNPDEVARRVVKRDVERVQRRMADLLKTLDVCPVNKMEILSDEAAIPLEVVHHVINEPITTQVIDVKEDLPQEKVQESRKAEVAAIISSSILAESFRPAADLKHSISLNDSFRFSRELFGGSSERMNATLQEIAGLSSLNEALEFLSKEVKVDEENEVLADFQELLKKFFI